MDIKSLGPLQNIKNVDAKEKTPIKNQEKESENSSKIDSKSAAVVFEKSEPLEESVVDYSKLGREKKHLDEIERLKLEIDHKMKNAFFMMVKDTMNGQNTGMKAAIQSILDARGESIEGEELEGAPSSEITQEMIDEAEADVSEGGYFSVEAVTERIMSFAKSLAGDDPSKALLLKGAFEVGFEEATKIWGDDLPQISQDTFAAVSKAFDEWEQEYIDSMEHNQNPDNSPSPNSIIE